MRRFALMLLIALGCLSPRSFAAGTEISWQSWSPQVFAQAKAQHKFVFLYLEAVWCHWCHVMQEDTLRDAAVRKALGEHWLAVKVDHDADPLLANRYRDYGWPALIFFAPDGTELVKRAGYIAPEDFQRLLGRIVADPTPEKSDASAVAEAGPSRLGADARKHLLQLHDESYDAALGGLKTGQKFLDRDSVEYALVRAAANDAAETKKARQTLDAARALLDPVWGGFYQYSTNADWQHPHYEKIMRVQGPMLRTYALAYGLWHQPADLAAAQSVRDYLFKFLRSPDGAFYVSQDADLVQGKKAEDYFVLDDAGRRKLGLPRIDMHLYADANGQAVEGLAVLYEFSGDESALTAARIAAEWTMKNRALSGGGFAHGEKDRGGPFLGDTLYLGRACLELYRATAERRWLDCARGAGDFIVQRFRGPSAGFVSAAANDSPVAPLPDIEENIATARFLNLLSRYTGSAEQREGAEQAMKFLSADSLIASRVEEAGILLADDELRAEPAHFTVVGAKGEAVSRALFEQALRAPGAYKRLEWWDRAEGPLPNADVPYPNFPKPAGYICTNNRCSRPSFEAADYAKQIIALTKLPVK